MKIARTVRRRQLITLSAAALVLALAAMQLAFAQAWPTAKPITLVVGYPPGGSTDLTARTLGAELSRKLGQTVVIENVGGAGGTIGAQKVASAAPDGYTLLLGSNNEMAISKLVSAAAKYDPLRDFTPIGLVASQPMVLVASAKSGVKTTDEFIKAAKANPGKFSYGSSGVGTALNLAGEMVKEASGAYVVHIPYRGVAPLANDLLGGQLDFGVFVLSSGLPHIKSGKVVALGITEAKRSAAAPGVPTLSAHPQLKNVDISSRFGLWAPAGLPVAVNQKLNQALNESLASPDLRKKFEESGAVTANGTTALAGFQKTEIDKYERIVKFAKIRE